MPRLTAEQRAMRLTGIGGSEGAAIVGMHPFKSAVDVWMAKPTPSRPPMVDESEDVNEEGPADTGHALEEALVDLYQKRTGIAVDRCSETLRHPTIPSVLATPDGLSVDGERGLEIKVVGSRMAHHWESESIPDYVLMQVVQGMAVTGRDAWDIGALIGGTSFQIYTVTRDMGLESSLTEAIETFWEVHVLGDRMPDVTNPDEHRAYLRKRYPGSSKTACLRLDDPRLAEDVETLIRWRLEAGAWLDRISAAEKQITNALCERIGDAYGIEGPWGKFIWPKIQGRVDWKAVAEDLGAGKIPVGLIEKHRGEPSRRPGFYPPSTKKALGAKKRT